MKRGESAFFLIFFLSFFYSFFLCAAGTAPRHEKEVMNFLSFFKEKVLQFGFSVLRVIMRETC